MNSADFEFNKFLKQCTNRRHKNHQAAWREFDRRYHDLILHRVLSLTKDKAESEEILCVILAHLVLRDYAVLRSFRGDDEKTFISYLARISHRKALAHVMNKRMDSDELDESMPLPAEDPETEVLVKYTADIVHSLLGKEKGSEDGNLERDLFILIMRKIMGFRSEQVARIPLLGVSEHNVNVAVNRLGRRVRDRLQEAGDDWTDSVETK